MSIHPARLKIGLIGCGKVAAEHHLPSLKRLDRADVAALADIQPDRLERLAKEYAIAATYPTAEELLRDPDIEAVGILTHTPSHHQLGLAALRAGKHVFLEKPLALSRRECDELLEAGQAFRRKTMVCFNLRWHRLVLQAKEMLDSGRLGTVVAIRSVYTHFRDGNDAPDWHRKLCKGGGVTFNESVHHLDLWRHLLKQEIEEVFAFHAPSAKYEDETSIINARLSGGTLATAVNTFRTSPSSEIEIFGSRGRLVLSLYRFDGLRFYGHAEYPGSLSVRLREISRSLRQLSGIVPTARRGGGFGETFYHAWDHFLDAVRSGGEPQPSFADGRQAVLASLAAIESFRSNRPVAVDKENALPCR